MRVVADTANGVGGLVVPAVFAGLPFDLTMLYGELDGTFPNHPARRHGAREPRRISARRCSTATPRSGLAFDGDADRVVLVDDQGEAVSGSTTTAILAAAMLGRHPGETVVHNVICSKAVPEVIRELGGKPVKSRVGHSFMKQVMADTDAIFGGEHSAHYYFRENFRADSGIIAALIVLEQLSKTGTPLSELRKPYERYAQSGEINSRVPDPLGGDRARRRRVPRRQQDRLDGLTVDMGDWWFNLRPSNTEPLLRLNLEAPTAPACDEHTAEVLAVVRGTSPDQPPTPRRRQRRSMALDPKLLEILACPEDKGPLLYFEDESSLYNPRLKRRYTVRDDIPIMLIDEAETVDDAENDRLVAKADADGIQPTFEV